MKYGRKIFSQLVGFLAIVVCSTLNAAEERWFALGYLNDTLLTLDSTNNFPVYNLVHRTGPLNLSALRGKLVKIDGIIHRVTSHGLDTIYVDSIKEAKAGNPLFGYARTPSCTDPISYKIYIDELGMANCQMRDSNGSSTDTFQTDLFKLHSLMRMMNENYVLEMPNAMLPTSYCISLNYITIGEKWVGSDGSPEMNTAFGNMSKSFEQYISSRCFPMRIAVGLLQKSVDTLGIVHTSENIWDAYTFKWSVKYDSLIGKSVQIRGRIKQDDLRCLSCPQQLIVVDTIFEINSTDKPLISYTTLGGVFDITEVDIYADGRIVRSTCVIDEKALSLSLLNRSISAFVMNGYFELDSRYDFNLGRYHPVYYAFSFQGKDVVFYGCQLHPTLSAILQEMKAINDLVKIEKAENNVFKKINATPNPFNPQTAVSFSLNKKMRIKLALYDLKGRLVAKIKDEICETGSYQILFKASHLPGGIYLLRLDGEGLRLTQKITLLK